MFGWIVGGIAALAFGGIAYKEVTKTTGEKVKDGDTVFVRADKLRLAETATLADTAGLQAFLAGFINTNVKVTNVHLTPQSNAVDRTIITGTIVGFPRLLAFSKADVTSIERNGARIV